MNSLSASGDGHTSKKATFLQAQMASGETSVNKSWGKVGRRQIKGYGGGKNLCLVFRQLRVEHLSPSSIVKAASREATSFCLDVLSADCERKRLSSQHSGVRAGGWIQTLVQPSQTSEPQVSQIYIVRPFLKTPSEIKRTTKRSNEKLK